YAPDHVLGIQSHPLALRTALAGVASRCRKTAASTDPASRAACEFRRTRRPARPALAVASGRSQRRDRYQHWLIRHLRSVNSADRDRLLGSLISEPVEAGQNFRPALPNPAKH